MKVIINPRVAGKIPIILLVNNIYKRRLIIVFMDKIFEITDKFGNKIRLTNKQYKHIQKHPYLHDLIEILKLAIKNPTTIRYNEEDESVKYFYKEFKEMLPEERYLLVSIKFLNKEGFIITAFYTNKITGSKWKI